MTVTQLAANPIFVDLFPALTQNLQQRNETKKGYFRYPRLAARRRRRRRVCVGAAEFQCQGRTNEPIGRRFRRRVVSAANGAYHSPIKFVSGRQG